MNKQMLNMDDLDQVYGGNALGDAWKMVCDKVADIYNKIMHHKQPDDIIIAGKGG